MKPYLTYLKINSKESFQDWAKVITVFLGTLFFAFTLFVSFDFLYKNIDSIGGLSRQEFFVLFGVSQILMGFIFGINFNFIGELLDEYLLETLTLRFSKPISILGALHFQFNDLSSLSTSMIGVIIILFNIPSINILNIIPFFFLLVLGYVLVTCIFIIFGCLGCLLRTDYISSFITRSIDIIRYPFTIFPNFLQFILIFIIPLSLVCYVPEQSLLGKLSFNLLALFISVVIGFVILTTILWKITLYKYRKG